jgi:hypothetical protein
MPSGLVDDVWNPAGCSDVRRRSCSPVRMPQPDRSPRRSMPAQHPMTMLTRSTQFPHPVRWGNTRSASCLTLSDAQEQR